jgi:hypothetical protein
MSDRSMTCWAACLGDCAGGVSREHIVSKNQFASGSRDVAAKPWLRSEKTVTAWGMPWCRKARSVGLGSLVAKNLCQRHNSQLSPADDEAKRLKHALAVFLQKDAHLPTRVRIDARLFERWLIKTAINCSLQETASGLNLTPRLVEWAYGRIAPQPRLGFHLIGNSDGRVSFDGNFEFVTLEDVAGTVVVVLVSFNGLRVVLALEEGYALPTVYRPERLHTADETSWIRFVWQPPLDSSETSAAWNGLA